MGEIHRVRSGVRGSELPVLSGQVALPAPPHAHQPRSSENPILEDFQGGFFIEAQLLKLLAFAGSHNLESLYHPWTENSDHLIT